MYHREIFEQSRCLARAHTKGGFVSAVRVQQALAALDPDRMTPVEALVALAGLKRELGGG